MVAHEIRNRGTTETHDGHRAPEAVVGGLDAEIVAKGVYETGTSDCKTAEDTGALHKAHDSRKAVRIGGSVGNQEHDKSLREARNKCLGKDRECRGDNNTGARVLGELGQERGGDVDGGKDPAAETIETEESKALDGLSKEVGDDKTGGDAGEHNDNRNERAGESETAVFRRGVSKKRQELVE